MINFMCQFNWAKGCSESWKTLFLGVSVRLFPEDISIWMGELNKADGPPWCRKASADPLRGGIEHKNGGMGNSYSLLELEHPSLLSFHMELWSPWFLGLQLQNQDLHWRLSPKPQSPLSPSSPPLRPLDWIITLAFLVPSLQMADLQSSQTP